VHRSQLRRRVSKPILDLCLRKSQSRKFQVEQNQQLRRRIGYCRAWEQAAVPVCGRWRMIATHAGHGVSYCGATKCPELGANGGCRTPGTFSRSCREFFPNRADGTLSPSEKIRRHLPNGYEAIFPMQCRLSVGMISPVRSAPQGALAQLAEHSAPLDLRRVQ
jgi:hypothetical protein